MGNGLQNALIVVAPRAPVDISALKVLTY